MDLKEIQELIKMVDESGLTEFELKQEDYKIVLKKEKLPPMFQPAFQPVQSFMTGAAAGRETVTPEQPSSKIEASQTINAPIVGTFYLAPSPGEKPFVSAGSKVKKGDTLCIVEAMKLMNEIEAEEDLQILSILVDDGQMVEFGQPLFEINTK
ncbi:MULTISPECIES: acetyl-CoA carboxylase biotin carboxyl carrier protein [unclassified Dehalobacter]|jgi:acetyl-CoA carboxylase, biotin carboxyl carrier protein|uniref:acetyl-CoA carboxylase biotin carboxyl carrier protein n=1 Tax=unclassified Dehalobacter TaxID=2635733 RepID=UPI00028A9212|nr:MULTISPECIES: acetyl-CoA carboxylase biotin carboxyl carrier protein [unclassified Dehalobacter]AFV03736.1 Biotin carboxyl carrier protein of acetyl-CoA carboxylase [Dehalobacter sp. DCA]AFV06722.1 Biotin carboxyl carrier protein of acetyl-CoA carboxylase [Dehalobacter sp. CF]